MKIKEQITEWIKTKIVSFVLESLILITVLVYGIIDIRNTIKVGQEAAKEYAIQQTQRFEEYTAEQGEKIDQLLQHFESMAGDATVVTKELAENKEELVDGLKEKWFGKNE